ncbi:MAG: L,D-transpeptidase family protein [Burkholderiales bacterium]|nr:L,D-transpeptidase family protein [Burkholderiales bacterium]
MRGSRALATITAFALAAAALFTLEADTHAMARKPAAKPGAAAAKASVRDVTGVEAALLTVLDDVGAADLGAALDRVDRVIAANPNFRLAHLIKGDLLLARSRPITGLGNLADAPVEPLADLRDEARARVARRLASVPPGGVPSALVKLAPTQHHALVVDTSHSTLYVFENRDGVPTRVADYYITIGRNGVEKAREGDKRTPLGVYHVTSSLPRKALGDFYGAGAYPISYPNEWDRRQGRGGHGIWLHGTPSDTYSRPPRASDGCVVLTNDDLQALARRLQIGTTPVVITDRVEWVAPEVVSARRGELEAALEAWRRDWESLDTERYLRHYAADFRSDGMTLAEWGAQKRAVAAGKTHVKVRLEDTSVFQYPGAQPMALVTFVQDYRSNNLDHVMRKRLYWAHLDGRWQIMQEGAVTLPSAQPRRRR